ncbi:MAG: carbohydrate ABC transporter permease [bacterium]|nr:carbohydrate ABC transporter permease [bacterium]
MTNDRLSVRITRYILLTLGALIMVIPFIWMFLTAFKTTAELNQWPPTFLPETWRFENFADVFRTAPFAKYFLNSLIMSSVSTIAILYTSTMAGYIFAKYRFFGKTAIFGVILATAIVPFEVYMIPVFMQLRGLELADTMGGLIAPYLVMSFGIFFMRQNVSALVPDEIIEAARADGASEFRIFFQIVLPMLGSSLAALGIFAFLEAWNAYVWPLIVVNSDALFTMELGLSQFQSAFTLNIPLVTAGSLISILPILIVYIVLRRQIMDSFATTGLKG